MKRQLILLLIFNLHLAVINANGQFSKKEQFELDSLNSIISSSLNNDTTVIRAILEKAWYYYLSSPDTAILLCQQAEQKALNSDYTLGLANSYGWLGVLYEQKGLIEKALDYSHKGLLLQEQLGKKENITLSLSSIASLYSEVGDYESSLDYYKKSLVIEKGLSLKEDMAISMLNIGFVYSNLNQYDEAINYYLQAEIVFKELLAISPTEDAKNGYATCLNNIGTAYERQNDLNQAMQYYQMGLEIQEDLESKVGMAVSLCNIGSLQMMSGLEKEANKSLNRALILAKESGSPRWIANSSRHLSNLLKQSGNFEEALIMYELNILMRDSIINEQTQKATIRQQTKYEFEKAQLVKEQILKEENRKLKEQTERRDNLQYSIILIVIVALLSLLFTLGKFRISTFVAEGLIFFVFLLLFEFLLVLVDPYIDQWTAGEPMYKLLINALLAGAIFPVHAFFEKVLKSRLVKL